MRIMQRVIPAALVLGAAFVSPAFSAGSIPTFKVLESAPARPDGRNAALYYWRAFYTLDRDFQRASSDMLVSDRTADWKPSGAALTGLNENSSFVTQILQATRIDRCDFDIAYEEGFMALLPHLGPMRAGARILALDAHRLMGENKPDEAAERIAGIYRMAAHIRNDNVLISSLVSIAIASLAADEATMFANAGKLTDAGRGAIVAALQPLNQADGFNTKKCIDMERRIAVDFLRRELKGPEAGKKLFRLGLDETNEETKKQVEAMDEAAIAKDLDRLTVYYKEVLTAWDDKDYAAQFKQKELKLEAGEYGVLAKFFVPAMTNAKKGDTKGQDRVREVLQVLTQPSPTPAAPPAPPAGRAK